MIVAVLWSVKGENLRQGLFGRRRSNPKKSVTANLLSTYIYMEVRFVGLIPHR
jgi:hypothetical protein